MHIFIEQLLFFLTLTWLFFIPGILFVHAFTAKTTKSDKKVSLTPLELFVSGFSIGIILLDFLLIIINKGFELPLTRSTILLAPLISIIVSTVIYRKIYVDDRKLRNSLAAKPINATRRMGAFFVLSLKNFSIFTKSNQKPLPVILLILLTIVIKVFYLTDTLFPTATDMGHHLYWVNQIAATHELQEYKKQELITIETGTYAMSDPALISDFIIGEHIPLAAIQIATGQDILSVQPILFLFLLDIMSLLALFVLARRLFAHMKSTHTNSISLAVLFLMGPLYTISSAQAKFISGGVIGNLFGNLFIPVALFFLYRALNEKSSRFFSLFLITSAGLAYTHHLSVFILAYIILFTIALFAILNIHTIFTHILSWLQIIIKPVVIITLLAIIALLFLYTPNYLNPDDITSATGAPSKDTRTGVSLTQLIHTIGEARFAFGVVGFSIITILAYLHLFRKIAHSNIKNILKIPYHSYCVVFIIAWPLAIFAISTAPQFFGVNIISSRIANYTIIPFTLIGGVGLWWLVYSSRTHLHRPLAYITITLLLLFPLTSGMYDNSQSLKTVPNITEAQESFAAAKYITTHAASDEWTLKDHNFLTSDTWMKLFFLRDYSYPLSRSYFKRYSYGTRETCTLDMISAPHSTHAQQCFTDLNVRYVIVHPEHDAAQFKKSDKFDQIYSSNHITVFYRK